MNTDWNWFFSSLSQSAAALIGIIGAFVISRLIGLSERIHTAKSNFDDLVIKFNQTKSSLSNRRFSWYVRNQVDESDKISEAIESGEFKNLSDQEVLAKIYNLEKKLFKVDDEILKAFRGLNLKIKKSHDQQRDPLGFTSGISPKLLDLKPAGFWDNLRDEGEAINSLKVEAISLIQYFQKNKTEAVSLSVTIKPLRIIILLLMVAFPLTVIYPLHFMPVLLNNPPEVTFNPIDILKTLFSLKFIILFILFLTIEGIFFYFLIITKQLLVSSSSIFSDLEFDYMNIKSYSQFFE
ncbi:MAG: hypothetical protein M0Q26_13505 [Chitinophagaceae bacterium]|nr:hypothetical protein [Chitinophagaceae bacterium]